jgi:putative heme-binding domain-containing protein
MKLACLLGGLAMGAWAQYTIERAPGAITIDGKLDEAAWRAARPMGDFHFHWHESGEKEQTVAKMLWDDEHLYVAWYVHDKHISAYERQRHGPVSKDDCVEIFIAPNPAKVKNYYTWEINAIGTALNRNRSDWYTLGATWEPEGVEYRTTFQGMEKKDEAAGDSHWIVEMKVPLKNFARDAANTPPKDGDEWRLNVNRIGGKTNAQASSWAPIPRDVKSFHTPEAFGKVVFSTRAAGGRQARFDAAEARAGQKIYNRSCTMCHGLNGAAGDRAPALGAQRRYLRGTSEELFDAIKNGIKGTGMPGSPLGAGDVNKLVAYIHSLRATAVDVDVAGDVERGRAVFAGKGNCTKCHMVNGQGGILGPDLSNVGAERSLAALREALIVAKPTPPRGYQPVKVTTVQGRVIEGVLKNQHNTSFQILGKDERLHLLLAEEIRTMERSEKSLMPAGVDKRLTADEFADLVAYLSRQARSRR